MPKCRPKGSQRGVQAVRGGAAAQEGPAVRLECACVRACCEVGVSPIYNAVMREDPVTQCGAGDAKTIKVGVVRQRPGGGTRERREGNRRDGSRGASSPYHRAAASPHLFSGVLSR
jgi:hypothetical protein